jgi:hypothetical protein
MVCAHWTLVANEVLSIEIVLFIAKTILPTPPFHSGACSEMWDTVEGPAQIT